MQRRIEKLEDRQLLAVVLTPDGGALMDRAAGVASHVSTASSLRSAAAVAQVAVLNITDGDWTPSAAKGTDFGSVLQGAAVPTRTYTVRNVGTAVLTLGSERATRLHAGQALGREARSPFVRHLYSSLRHVHAGRQERPRSVSPPTTVSGTPSTSRSPAQSVRRRGSTSRDSRASTSPTATWARAAHAPTSAGRPSNSRSREPFTILNQGAGPLVLTGNPPVKAMGPRNERITRHLQEEEVSQDGFELREFRIGPYALEDFGEDDSESATSSPSSINDFSRRT